MSNILNHKDKTKNFLVGTMIYPIYPNGEIVFAFVTSKERGHAHYRQVRKQAIYGCEPLSRYGQSLFDSCFKNW